MSINNLKESKDNIETFGEILNILNENQFKSVICNLDNEIVYCSSDNFEIKPNEIMEIKNIFDGQSSTGFFINGKRYFLKSNDNYYINGSSMTEKNNIMIERTNNNKCFIISYDSLKFGVEEVNLKFSQILESYFKNNKEEIISNTYK